MSWLRRRKRREATGYTCPRRMNEWGPWQQKEGMDGFTAGHGLVDQERGCTFCGSMHPDDFMAAARRGETLGPSDKDYKVYVQRTLSLDEINAKVETAITGYVEHGMSRAEAQDLVGKQREGYDIYANGGSIGKFYFQHLSEEQMREFIDLLNAKRLTIGYPGYFYRTPFFMARDPRPAA